MGFLALGLCTTDPRSNPNWWASGKPADTERACRVCRVCSVQVACREWSLHLPERDTAIYGGQTRHWRKQRRAELAAAGRPVR